MAKPAHPHPDQLALYEKLVATHPDIPRKGAKNPYTSLNGHMFSFLDREGKVSLRLPAEEREAFLKNHRTKLSVQYDTVMKEYVVVPARLLRKTAELEKYFASSVAYIASLEPKPTTRKKKTKKKSARKKKKA